MKASKDTKILILEDVIPTAQALQAQLENLDYEAKVVYNWEDAIKAVEENLPDIFICDIKLEGQELDGIETVKEIQKKISLPVVYLTGHSDTITLRRAFETAPAGYLLKEYLNEETLKVTLHRVLNTPTEPSQETHESEEDERFISDGTRKEKVKIDDILFLKADSAWCHVITSHRHLYLAKNLRKTLELINHSFLVRTHSSYAINMKKIDAIEGNQIIIYRQRHIIQDDVWKKMVELTGYGGVNKDSNQVREVRILIGNAYKNEFESKIGYK